MEKFYVEIKAFLNLTKPHELSIIQGDFKAKGGRIQVGEVVGKWGLGERNVRGVRLVQFCQEENFKISNTSFCLQSSRLYT